jgi:hypothetical protein
MRGMGPEGNAISSGYRHIGRARHSVRAGIVVWTGGVQRTARPTEVCSGCHQSHMVREKT